MKAKKTQVIDKGLLDYYISKSGYKVAFLCEKMGISGTAWYKKVSGENSFRVSEVFVLQTLLKISDDDANKIFYPEG